MTKVGESMVNISSSISESFQKIETDTSVVPYDEYLLDRARVQWQFGDWESLAKLERATIKHHPERAKLALLAAAGRLQTDGLREAREFLILARDWGCSNRLISQILVSGVYNSLGRAYILTKNNKKSLQHFGASISSGMPQLDIKLATQARHGKQLVLLGESASWIFIQSEGEGATIEGHYLLSHWRDQAIENSRYKALFNYLVRKDVFATFSGKQNGILLADSPLGDGRGYYIKPGYASRTTYHHYDDMEEEDKWQLEVYLHAFSLMKKNKFSTVADIGCGSGYKLINYLGDFETIGFELKENVEKLRAKYPERLWVESSFGDESHVVADLVICSDVIEHLVYPNKLLSFLQLQSFEYLIISTPDRNLVRGFDDCGPPKNVAHVREWSFIEFRKYISDWFEILDHRITNIEQGTQMVVCRKL